MGGPGSGPPSGSGQLKPHKARLPKRQRPGWLKRMDQRSRIAQMLHSRLATISDDLGGLPELTGIQASLLERFVHAEALAAQIEERARNGSEFDVAQYLAITDRVLRLGVALGLHRKAKRVPTLPEYIAQKAHEKSPDEGEAP
jgi:hypothetical protein